MIDAGVAWGRKAAASGRCSPKRSNSRSISPASINSLRNSQIVVAPVPVLEFQIEKAHKRYAVADQVFSPFVRRLWSDCSTTILNLRIVS